MSDKNSKQLRGQLRQIVKEMLPELIAAEYYTNLTKKNREELDLIRKLVGDTLAKIDDRQKTIQAAVLRELAKPPQAPVTPAVSEDSKENS